MIRHGLCFCALLVLSYTAMCWCMCRFVFCDLQKSLVPGLIQVIVQVISDVFWMVLGSIMMLEMDALL